LEIQDPELIKEIDNYSSPINYRRKQLFKDFKQKLIYTDYEVWGGSFFVKDVINLQDWEQIDSSDVVLSYKCQMAKTIFRGRTYLASYTTEIPIADGPFKFQGLPGMILKVKAIGTNEDFQMECTAIKKKNVNVDGPFKDYLNKNSNRFVDWDAFQINVKDYFKKKIKTLQSKPESDGKSIATIKSDVHPEIFYKEFQTTGITFEF